MLTSSILTISQAAVGTFLSVAAGAALLKHRTDSRKVRTSGLSEYLMADCLIDDGVLLCKNGALLAAWIFRGRDLQSSDDSEINGDSSLLNRFLKDMGDGWMIHVDVIRKETPRYMEFGKSFFPDRLSAICDAERRSFFESRGTLYEGYSVISVTWLPPTLTRQKLTAMMYTGGSDKRNIGMKLLAEFKQKTDLFASRLSAVFSLERLKSYESEDEFGTKLTFCDLLSHLHHCVTGLPHPIALPPDPIRVDGIIGGQDFQGGIVPRIGLKYIQVVSIEGVPSSSFPGILSGLTDLDIEYRWSTRFIALDRATAEQHMTMLCRKWKQKQRGFVDQLLHLNGRVDGHAVAMTADAEQAMSEISSGDVAAGYYTSCIILMDEDIQLLETSAKRLDKYIRNLGFTCRIEDVNAMDAFFGSIPGHGYENVRRPMITTRNLAHFLPTGTIWTGSENCPNPMYPADSPALMYTLTTGNSPFRLNLHVRDLGHTLIIGPTGSGKSTLLGQLILQMPRYRGASIVAFDKGLSLYPLTKGMGGQHYEIGADDSSLSFAPLSRLDTPGGLNGALEWIVMVLSLNGIEASPQQRQEIRTVLDDMRGMEKRSISIFAALIQDESIRAVMEDYSVAGSMGTLLDAEEDGLDLSATLTTFEIEKLMQLGQKWLLPILQYIFQRIEQNLNGQPAFIVIDEAWAALGNPVFRETLKRWLKEFRKRNAAVILATQSLSDATRSEIFDVIVESTATKIFLPNERARSEGFAETYRNMGLNDQQIAIISGAVPKRQYYLSCEKGSRLFELAIQPIALAFVGVSDREKVLAVKKLEAEHPSDWMERWLETRHLAFPAECRLEYTPKESDAR